MIENRAMKLIKLACVTFVLLISCPVFASGVVEEVSDYAQFTRNPHFHILVVSVLEINKRVTTNANPPNGKLKVDDIIRGRIVKPGSYRFLISPPIGGEDIERVTNKPMKEWLEKGYVGPSVGDKLIIFVYTTREALRKTGTLFIQGPIYRYTEENRFRVTEQMALPERTVWIQLPLFFVILLLPVASIIFSAISRKKNINKVRKQNLKAISLLLPLLSIILYIYYESGISSYSDIRIDLLIIWPAMIANGVMIIVYSLEMIIGIMRKKGN